MSHFQIDDRGNQAKKVRSGVVSQKRVKNQQRKFDYFDDNDGYYYQNQNVYHKTFNARTDPRGQFNFTEDTRFSPKGPHHGKIFSDEGGMQSYMQYDKASMPRHIHNDYANTYSANNGSSAPMAASSIHKVKQGKQDGKSHKKKKDKEREKKDKKEKKKVKSSSSESSDKSRSSSSDSSKSSDSKSSSSSGSSSSSDKSSNSDSSRSKLSKKRDKKDKDKKEKDKEKKDKKDKKDKEKEKEKDKKDI